MFKNIITKLLYCLVELLLILYPQLCALTNIKTIIFGLQNYFVLKTHYNSKNYSHLGD